MAILIVTGLSGAGKSTTVDALEDIGYFCIDNIPAKLLPKIIDFALHGESDLEKVAVVMDVRGAGSLEAVQDALANLDALQVEYQILFLDAGDDALERRYKETRRIHPLSVAHGLSTAQAIEQERQILRPLLERADYILDTTLLTTAQHKERICQLFLGAERDSMAVTVMSFGFKYGQPKEADILLDVRCLPNPFYVPELKNKTGLDQEVVDYVMQFDQSKGLLKRIEDLLEYSLPLYVKEGKSQLTVAIGCTGGKHRSITFARLVGEYCLKLGYRTNIVHRDAQRFS